jgi:hypothetical protein
VPPSFAWHRHPVHVVDQHATPANEPRTEYQTLALVSAVNGALGRHRPHGSHDPAPRQSLDSDRPFSAQCRASPRTFGLMPIPTSLPCGPRPATLRRTLSSQHPSVARRWNRTSAGRIRTTMDPTWRDVLIHGSPTLRHSDAVRDPLRVRKFRLCFGSRLLSPKIQLHERLRFFTTA